MGLRETNPEAYAAQLERNRAWKRESRRTLRGALQTLLYASRTNASKSRNQVVRETEHELTLDHLEQLWTSQFGLCALTGDEMTYGDPRQPSNVSIDRINSALGYLPGNVWLVTSVANRVKTDLSLEDLLDICRKILAQHDQIEEGAA